MERLPTRSVSKARVHLHLALWPCRLPPESDGLFIIEYMTQERVVLRSMRVGLTYQFTTRHGISDAHEGGNGSWMRARLERPSQPACPFDAPIFEAQKSPHPPNVSAGSGLFRSALVPSPVQPVPQERARQHRAPFANAASHAQLSRAPSCHMRRQRPLIAPKSEQIVTSDIARRNQGEGRVVSPQQRATEEMGLPLPLLQVRRRSRCSAQNQYGGC